MGLDDDLSELVRTRGDQLLRVAYQLTHDRAAAQDLVQETLVRVYSSWQRRQRRPDHLEAYVRRSMVNEFLKRRPGRSPAPPLASANQAVAGSFDSDLVEHDELWRALRTLSASQRAVLVLRYYEDLPGAEIATVMRCRRTTVRSLAARGLAALRANEAATPVTPRTAAAHEEGSP